jgi:uncharacterized protein (UPF0548 family)
MILFRPPDEAFLADFLRKQNELPVTSPPGLMGQEQPAGFDVDRTRIEVGRGEAVFQRLVTAIREWKQFDLGWVSAWPVTTPIEVGQPIAVVARASGLWWLNACRIVSTIDEETSSVRRFGFVYATLPGHIELGEERFLAEWNTADDRVSFDITAISQPKFWMIRLAYPLVRRAQRKFALGATSRMQQVVDHGLIQPPTTDT